VVRNLLSGTDLGHPLHPTLTDVQVGALAFGVFPGTYERLN
jgi:hypothetical protein